MNVNNLLENASPYQVQQDQAVKLAGKWEKSGLLEGISNTTEANNMAILLENQAKQLVNEVNSVASSGAGSSFNAGNSEAWAGVALPLVRRVFGEIVAKDLVSVQPMNLPAGLIFYLDFQYGNTTDEQTAGDSLYAASSDLKTTDLPAAGAKKGLYGAGTYGYSVKDNSTATLYITGSTTAGDHATLDGVIGATTASIGTITAAETGSLGDFDTEFFAGKTLNTIDVIRVSTSSFTNPDFETIRAWAVDGQTNYSQYNKFTKGNDYVELVYAGETLSSGEGSAVINYLQTPDNLDDRGDFEDGNASTTAVSTLDIPTIDVQLRSDTVAAKTRKLKAQWTPEFAQDLNAYHSIDAEAELTSILSEYISMEIDLEILDMLIRNADTTSHWSAKVAKEVNDSGAVTDESGTGLYYTKMSWFQTLGVKLQKVSNLIHQKTLRGGANFMVVSPKISTILESIPGFAADSAGDQDKYAMGVQKIGAINARYTVYKNPYMTENVILMGYKGSQFLETGAVFAPYIPLIMTPLVYDPVSFTPRKGIMTRYAKKMVRPDFYGKVVCHDLNQL